MLKSPRRASAKLWRALASPVRRRILDRLRGGPRTTSELAAAFPKLSRFAVMQHLRVLSGARLVLIRREGRFRFNYLNAVPLVQAYERWVSAYAAPMAHGALALKRFVERTEEGDGPVPADKPRHEPRLARIESEVRLDAPPARVFEALTTRLDEWWQFRVREQSTIVVEPRIGGHIFEDWGDGRGVLYGTIAQYDPPHSFCSAGVNGWKSATFITWHRLEPASDGRATILRKSMQFFGDVDDEFVSRMEQGNRAIMEKQLKDFVERGIGR